LRTNLLLGAAAVGLLITGAIAQTTSHFERIKDPAAQNAEPQKKNVRTVYPNTQNAEQAAKESRGAQGRADASKPGDVTPLPNVHAPSSPPPNQATSQASPPAQQSQQSAQTPSPQGASPSPAQTAQPSPPPAQPSNAAPADKPQSAPTATAQQSSPPSQPAASQAGRASSSIVALDTQQQTSIGQAIAQRGVKPLTNVNFSIAVGTKVPAAVQLRALPADLVTFVPQYRGYSYVVVEEQIVIVDPGTHEIVSIVPYTAAAPGTRTVETDKPRIPIAEKPMVNRSVNLNTEEKAVSRRPAAEQRKKTTRSVVKRNYREERAPRTVTVEESSEPMRGSAFHGHRFVDDDDDQVIVAPRQNGFFGFFR